MNVGNLDAQRQAPLRRLGELIAQCECRNADLRYGVDDVRGVSNTKNIQRTKANIDGRALDSFHVVTNGGFVFNRRTTRNGERLGLGYNNTDRTFIFTEDYVSFRVKDENVLDPDFLYILFLRDEFDRYVRWDSWGSATEFFNWENMCRVEIPVPPIDVQRKIAASWRGLRTMKQENEVLVEPLMQLCRSRLQEIKKQYRFVELSECIVKCDLRNSDGKYGESFLRGVNNLHEFCETRANTEGVNMRQYQIVHNNQFVYNPARLDIGSIGLFKGDVCIVSTLYEIFTVKDPTVLLADYLMLWFERSEFTRYVGFANWGSAREYFWFDAMCRVKIPLPPIDVQQAVVDLYRCANEAKKIAAEADDLSRACCPALVQFGAKGAA